MKYLLDTNIISEPTRLKPNPNVIKKLELESIFSCTSATAWQELWHGIHLLEESKRKDALKDYLKQLAEDGFKILPFCQQSAEWLAKERAKLKRKGIIVSKYDSEIAAVAYVNQLTLVTRNTNDFAVFNDIHIENWFL